MHPSDQVINDDPTPAPQTILVLVTPARDAHITLPQLAKSVLAQEFRPKLWVIVDDNSLDHTLEYARNLESEHDWIKCIPSRVAGRYDLSRYGAVVRTGIDHCRADLVNDGFQAVFVAVVDADVNLTPTYTKELCTFMLSNPDIALATGFLLDTGAPAKNRREDWPRGAARVYRVDFLDRIGGFPNLPCPDSCLDFLAFSEQLGIASLSVPTAMHLKDSWKGREEARASDLGKAHHELGYHSIRAIATAVEILRTRGAVPSAVYIREFLRSAFQGDPRVSDPRILTFTRSPLPLPVIRTLRDGAAVFRMSNSFLARKGSHVAKRKNNRLV